MEEILSQILNKYGLFGFVIVSVLGFFGLFFYKVLNHFMKSLESKDKQVSEISDKFSTALDNNTTAIQTLNENELRLSLTIKNLYEGLGQQATRHREEHAEILNFVRKGR